MHGNKFHYFGQASKQCLAAVWLCPTSDGCTGTLMHKALFILIFMQCTVTFSILKLINFSYLINSSNLFPLI